MSDSSTYGESSSASLEAKTGSIDARIAELQSQRESQLLNLSQQPEAWWISSNVSPMTVGLSILGFGLFVMLLAAYLLKTSRHHPQVVLRLLGTLTILTLAMFLVVIGYSDEQITLVMGLLGTVVGYLLGKESHEGQNNRADEELQNESMHRKDQRDSAD